MLSNLTCNIWLKVHPWYPIGQYQNNFWVLSNNYTAGVQTHKKVSQHSGELSQS